MQSSFFTKKLPSGKNLLEGENYFTEILHMGQKVPADSGL